MAEIQLKFTGMDEALKMLQSLPAEVVSKRGGPVKTALRKAALVILKEAKLNLDYVTHSVGRVGFDQEHSTGLLQKSLIASRGKPPPGENGERYLIRVKRLSYTRHGRRVTTFMTARFLEYGTEKQPAEPWLRPAGHNKAQEAIDVMTRELAKGIARVMRKTRFKG